MPTRPWRTLGKDGVIIRGENWDLVEALCQQEVQFRNTPCSIGPIREKRDADDSVSAENNVSKVTVLFRHFGRSVNESNS